MAFTPKTWEDFPSLDTPLEASAIIDTEERLSDYADSVAAGGIELGYAQRTSNFTQTGVGSSDVTGLSVTVTVASRPIVIELNAGSAFNSSGTGVTVVYIKEGATALSAALVSSTTIPLPVYRKVRLAPSAGSHTYKITMQQFVTGNSTLSASSTDPAFIQVLEV